MVAGLFAKHGVWLGTSDIAESRFNPKGSYENSAIKALLIERCGTIEDLSERPTTDLSEAIADAIIADGYVSGPWAFKASCLYHGVFAALDPIYVTVRRPIRSISESLEATQWRWTWAKVMEQNMLLDDLESSGAIRIDSELLIHRQYEQARNAFECCGLSFNEEVANSWVSPKLWHFR